MIVLGLTGSIGMGKSTAVSLFRQCGVPVHDADATVHALMEVGGAAVSQIKESFPNVLENGSVNRKKLGAIVFTNVSELEKLEHILHPLVALDRDRFLRRCMMQRHKIVLLDVPLLFETMGDVGCDICVTVSAPHFVQAARVLARSGVDAERLNLIRSKQAPDAMKRRLADKVLSSGLGKRRTYQQIKLLLRDLRQIRRRGAWPPKVGGSLGRGAGAGNHFAWRRSRWSWGPNRPIILSQLRKL